MHEPMVLRVISRLNGCYEALEGGNTTEALIDFTGGVSEPLRLDGGALSARSHQRRALFQTLAKAHEHKALITCSIRVRLLGPPDQRGRTLRFFSLSAGRGRGGGVGAGLRSGARTRLRDHGVEEGAAGGAGERGPALHGAHEEPLGDGRLDRRLEPGVGTLVCFRQILSVRL